MVNAQEYINQNYSHEQRKNITELNISQKNLTGSLNLHDFSNLELLLCPNNELTEIKVSHCPKLKSLDCWNNKLQELDFTNNHQLEGLVCSDNQLTGLKLSDNQNLTYLDCSNNQLANLNSVNNSPLLTDLICHGNSLENLDNYNFPKLTQEKFIWTNNAQQWLDWLYPEKKKNEVKKLSISNKQLGGSLKIEGFNDLEEAEFPWNGFFGSGISELVVNQCPKLKKINCRWSGNSLNKLTINGLENLENLDCAKNQLTELNINNCPNLKTLDCSFNKLTKLDLTNLKQLKQLDIRHNDFSEQDLTFLKNFNISEDSKIKQQNINSQYEVVIFLCHGLGSSASWFQGSTEQLQKELPYNVKLILPQAPTIKVDFGAIAGAKISPWRPSWYNIVSWEDVCNGNNDYGLLTSVAQINKLIDQEIAKGIKPENIFIAGLSQGGSLALAVGLTSKQKLGGIIGWAAFIPYQKVLQEKLTDISRKITFLLMHDCIDRIVEYKVAKEATDFLQANNYSPQFQTYFGAGHDHKLMLGDTINFLKKQLASKGLLKKDCAEQTNIEIVEIKEQEVVETNIEIPPKGN